MAPEALLGLRRSHDATALVRVLSSALDGGWVWTSVDRRLLAWANGRCDFQEQSGEPVELVLEVLDDARCRPATARLIERLTSALPTAESTGFGLEVRLRLAAAQVERGDHAAARAIRTDVALADSDSVHLRYELDLLDYRLATRPTNQQCFSAIKALDHMNRGEEATEVAFIAWLAGCGTVPEFLERARLDSTAPTKHITAVAVAWNETLVTTQHLESLGATGALRRALHDATMCREKWPLAVDEVLTTWAESHQPTTLSQAIEWRRLAQRLEGEGQRP